MNNKKDALLPVKNTLKSVLEFIKKHKKLTIAALVIILLGWLIFTPHGSDNKSSSSYEPAKSKYEEVDVAGLTVKDACDKLREKGWKMSDEVIGENDDYESVESSDCNDTTHKAKGVDYTADDFNAKLNDTAILYFVSDKKTASESKTDESTPAQSQETPKYEIVNTKQSVGVTGLDEYYVKIDPLDLDNDNFKSKVKLVVSAIAKDKQTTDFMAKIFTDSSVLAYKNNATSYYQDLVDTGVVTDSLAEWTKQMEQKSATAHIASYTGGFDYTTTKTSTASGAYKISWFPSTFTDNGTVGKYVGDEKWKLQR